MDWSTGDHTGVPVPLTATGPGAGRLTGVLPNTGVFAVMARRWDWQPRPRPQPRPAEHELRRGNSANL